MQLHSALLSAAFALLLSPTVVHAAAAGDDAPARSLPTTTRVVHGDLDDILRSRKRRIVVLVPYSRTLYFNDRGRESGIVADLARDFERYLNRKLHTGARPITVQLAPTTRDQLLPRLTAGLGDIAAGNLTATPARLELVDFVIPPGGSTTAAGGVDEIVLTGPKSAPVASAEDLSGRAVDVRPATSYYESLVALNERLTAAGRPTAKLRLLPDAIQDEDMLEMLDLGLLQTVVADDWLARLWQPVLPHVRLNTGAVLRHGSRIGWAIRRNSPALRAEIGDFFQRFVAAQGVVRMRQAAYAKRVHYLRDPTGSREWERFERTMKLFEKYGTRYGFDPLMLVAQGFQESQLDQSARSPSGAVGIMQLLPAVGTQMDVGDIHVAEANVHAGAKYMDILMARYFRDVPFTDTDRTLFAFASYNAGPANVARLRREAEKRGLDPNQWFNHVEVIASEKLGAQTTTYVRNIFKYYVAYRLAEDVRDEQRRARPPLEPN